MSCKRLVCCLQGHVALKVYVIKCNCFCYVFWTIDLYASKLNLILYHKPECLHFILQDQIALSTAKWLKVTTKVKHLSEWMSGQHKNIVCQSYTYIYVLYNWFLFATVTLPWPCYVKTQLLLATRFGVLRYYILYKYKHTKVAYIDSNTGSYSITGHAMRGIFPHTVTNLVHVWHSDKPPCLQPVEDVTGETRQRIHHDSDLDFCSWFMECV